MRAEPEEKTEAASIASRRPIALIGFSGAGKSTVARQVAPRLGLRCIDTDAAIEAACGKSVARIFAEEGEAFFRARECEALTAALDSEPSAIIACGGGTPVTPENFKLLRDCALVVYLRVSTAFALARAGDLYSRPLLAQAGTSEVIAALMDSRTALYEALADITITTDYRDVTEVCDTLVKQLRKANHDNHY